VGDALGRRWRHGRPAWFRISDLFTPYAGDRIFRRSLNSGETKSSSGNSLFTTSARYCPLRVGGELMLESIRMWHAQAGAVITTFTTSPRKSPA
jgi:hypothetical protein